MYFWTLQNNMSLRMYKYFTHKTTYYVHVLGSWAYKRNQKIIL